MQSYDSCLNCGTNLSHGSNYCPHCGQATHHHRLNLTHLGHELVHFFTHADKGIFYLVKMLAIRPGTVMREYVQGKRKKYFNPLNFFFIVIGLFVFVQTTFRPIDAVNMAEEKEKVRQEKDEDIRNRRLAKLERAEKASTFMAKYSNYINMAATPLFALVFFLCFRKAGYNYTEHLVVNLYIAGFSALFYIIIIAPFLVLARGKPVYFLGLFLYLLWMIFYRTVVYYGFINKRGGKHFLYTALVSLVLLAGWYFLSTSLIGKYIESGFL